jgi:uncharacterized membrane protein YesL
MAFSSAESQLSSKNTIGSLLLFCLSVLGFAAAILFGAASSRGVESSLAIVPVVIGSVTVLCVTLPGIVLFRCTHNTRYRASLRLSLLTLAILVVEFVGVFFFSPGS